MKPRGDRSCAAPPRRASRPRRPSTRGAHGDAASTRARPDAGSTLRTRAPPTRARATPAVTERRQRGRRPASSTCPGRHAPGDRGRASRRAGVSGYAAELTDRGHPRQGRDGAARGLPPPGGQRRRRRRWRRRASSIPEPEGGAAPKITVEPGAGGHGGDDDHHPGGAAPPEAGAQRARCCRRCPSPSRAPATTYVTVCTAPHPILVEDPIANELDPKVKPNPPGRPQREDWPLARIPRRRRARSARRSRCSARCSIAGGRGGPRSCPTAPQIPPWITALEELDEIRALEPARGGQARRALRPRERRLRRYLGARYGFEKLGQGYNGLETTTGEMLDLLRRVRPPIARAARASRTSSTTATSSSSRASRPRRSTASRRSRSGETIVRKTIPVMISPRPAAAGAVARSQPAGRGRREPSRSRRPRVRHARRRSRSRSLYPWLARGDAWFARHLAVPVAARSALVVVPVVWWWGTFGQDGRTPRLRIGSVRAARSRGRAACAPTCAICPACSAPARSSSSSLAMAPPGLGAPRPEPRREGHRHHARDGSLRLDARRPRHRPQGSARAARSSPGASG